MPEISGSPLLRWKNDYPYFRQLRRRLILILAAVVAVPLLVLAGAAFFHQYSTINSRAEQSLQRTAEELKEKIDLHLNGQLALLRLTASCLEQPEPLQPGRIKAELIRLRGSDPFLGLAVYDQQGRRLAGSGSSREFEGPETLPRLPTGFLGASCGFGETTADSEGSALYYTAFCRIRGEEGRILRAVFGVGPILKLLSGPDSDPAETFLVGRTGVFRNRPKASPSPPASSPPPERRSSGADGYLEASIQLDTAPWQCLVRRPRESLNRELSRIRNMGLIILLPLLVLAVAAAILTVNYLVGRLEADHRLIKNLDRQLKRAGRLANSVHLSHGPVHELKNTLVNIDTTVTCLQDALDQADSQLGGEEAFFRKIREELNYGQVMVERLHGNIRVSNLESIVSELDLNSLLKDLVELLGLELYLNRIVVETSFQDGLPLILGDPVQIRQVFMNILLNAVSAVDSDGRITILTSAENDDIVVTVIDDGPGIPTGQEDLIFDPLFTTRRGSSGMGLSICVSILEKMGGRIQVRNDPERGASFTVWLPRRMK